MVTQRIAETRTAGAARRAQAQDGAPPAPGHGRFAGGGTSLISAPLAAVDGGSRAAAMTLAQRNYGNQATQELLGRLSVQRDEPNATTKRADRELRPADLGPLLTQATRTIAQLAVAGHLATVNGLTDDLFWFAHPELAGQKIVPGTPAAADWLRIRDTVVRPILHPRSDGPTGPGATSRPGGVPDGMVPAGQVAADSTAAATPAATGPAGNATGGSGRTTGPGGAAVSDKYFTQDVGHYQDSSGGKVRLWLYGSSGANVCNMTSLTMSLVSIAGESQLRSKLIGLLRSGGMHEGASVTVGGKWAPLATALDEEKVAARIETIDLVTAVAIGTSGGYGSVTEAGTIARVAKQTGLAGAEVATGKTRLTDPGVRAAAAQLLAGGGRIIAGTVNHYVYLVQVGADGVILHDPAGARVTPGLTGMLFLHNGTAAHMAREFLAMDPARRERAIRRVSTNPPAAAIVNELPGIAALDPTARTAAIKALVKAHPESVTTGARNFYASSEFAENDLRVRVKLSAAP